MKISYCGALTLLALIVQCSVATATAYAQQQSNTNGAASNGTAPVYAQQNFKADARADNLYSYRNPASKQKPPWNTFQEQVRRMAAQSSMAAAQKLQPAQAANGASASTPAYNGMAAITGVAGSLLNLNSNPNAISTPVDAGSNRTINGTNITGSSSQMSAASGLGAVPGLTELVPATTGPGAVPGLTGVSPSASGQESVPGLAGMMPGASGPESVPGLAEMTPANSSGLNDSSTDPKLLHTAPQSSFSDLPESSSTVNGAVRAPETVRPAVSESVPGLLTH